MNKIEAYLKINIFNFSTIKLILDFENHFLEPFIIHEFIGNLISELRIEIYFWTKFKFRSVTFSITKFFWTAKRIAKLKWVTRLKRMTLLHILKATTMKYVSWLLMKDFFKRFERKRRRDEASKNPFSFVNFKCSWLRSI